jgi:hypothetical protein
MEKGDNQMRWWMISAALMSAGCRSGEDVPSNGDRGGKKIVDASDDKDNYVENAVFHIETALASDFNPVS